MWDSLWVDLHAATMAAGGVAYGAIPDAAIGISAGRIAFVGPRADLPGPPGTLARAVHRGGGRWATPGLVDCHTHLVHGGNRAREFEQRLLGASYEEIARAGGGILSTVRATRALDEDALLAESRPRLRALMRQGVTTVEIKSGYGLDTATELRMLRVARRLADEGVAVRTSYLAAHAVPPGEEADAYIDAVIADLPLAAPLADAVDAFCERIAFSPAQVARLFAAARALGLPVKLHADQLSDGGGGALAAGFGALSADHLEYLGEDGAAAMGRAGTVAVLLPGAYYVIRETRVPPIDALRRHGVPLALATDCNPGSSPICDPLLVMNMACTLFRLSPEEALAGFTREGARALGLADRGVLAPGLRADLALWDVGHPAELSYAAGLHTPATVLREGAIRA